jgi:hypothetical protein
VSLEFKLGIALTPNFPSNPFLVDGWFSSPTLISPNSFIHNQTTLNIKPTWISTHKLRTMQLGDDDNVEVGSGHVSIVTGAHVRVLSPINVCHFNATFV